VRLVRDAIETTAWAGRPSILEVAETNIMENLEKQVKTLAASLVEHNRVQDRS
jgi:hypothetical protein